MPRHNDSDKLPKIKWRRKPWGKVGDEVICCKFVSDMDDLDKCVDRLLGMEWVIPKKYSNSADRATVYLYYNIKKMPITVGKLEIKNNKVRYVTSLSKTIGDYTGDIFEGKFHGEGIVKINNSSRVFRGEFVSGQPIRGALQVRDIRRPRIYWGRFKYDVKTNTIYPEDGAEFHVKSAKKNTYSIENLPDFTTTMFDGQFYWDYLTKRYAGQFSIDEMGNIQRLNGTEYSDTLEPIYTGTYENNERKIGTFFTKGIKKKIRIERDVINKTDYLERTMIESNVSLVVEIVRSFTNSRVKITIGRLDSRGPCHAVAKFLKGDGITIFKGIIITKDIVFIGWFDIDAAHPESMTIIALGGYGYHVSLGDLFSTEANMPSNNVQNKGDSINGKSEKGQTHTVNLNELDFDEIQNFDPYQKYLNRSKILFEDHVLKSGFKTIRYDNLELEISDGQCEYAIDSKFWGKSSYLFTDCTDVKKTKKIIDKIRKNTKLDLSNSYFEFNNNTERIVRQLLGSKMKIGKDFEIVYGHLINHSTSNYASGYFLVMKIKPSEMTVDLLNGMSRIDSNIKVGNFENELRLIEGNEMKETEANMNPEYLETIKKIKDLKEKHHYLQRNNSDLDNIIEDIKMEENISSDELESMMTLSKSSSKIIEDSIMIRTHDPLEPAVEHSESIQDLDLFIEQSRANANLNTSTEHQVNPVNPIIQVNPETPAQPKELTNAEECLEISTETLEESINNLSMMV